MNIVSIYTSDHGLATSALDEGGWCAELAPCESDAKVTHRMIVNFNKTLGRAILGQYKVIDDHFFIYGMTDNELAMFILTYGGE